MDRIFTAPWESGLALRSDPRTIAQNPLRPGTLGSRMPSPGRDPGVYSITHVSGGSTHWGKLSPKCGHRALGGQLGDQSPSPGSAARGAEVPRAHVASPTVRSPGGLEEGTEKRCREGGKNPP